MLLEDAPEVMTALMMPQFRRHGFEPAADDFASDVLRKVSGSLIIYSGGVGLSHDPRSSYRAIG